MTQHRTAEVVAVFDFAKETLSAEALAHRFARLSVHYWAMACTWPPELETASGSETSLDAESFLLQDGTQTYRLRDPIDRELAALVLGTKMLLAVEDHLRAVALAKLDPLNHPTP